MLRMYGISATIAPGKTEQIHLQPDVDYWHFVGFSMQFEDRRFIVIERITINREGITFMAHNISTLETRVVGIVVQLEVP